MHLTESQVPRMSAELDEIGKRISFNFKLDIEQIKNVKQCYQSKCKHFQFLRIVIIFLIHI